MRAFPIASILSLFALGSSFGQDRVNFSQDVLPILSDHCFRCHGPDEKARKGDLRLDRKDDALRSASPVIVPGRASASELIKRIETSDADEVMPPPRANKKLTPAQVSVLKRWIDQGASWGEHWSFVKPVRPPLPIVSNSNGHARNPIDHFVLERLSRERLKPCPPADKERLIRRVTLDLTGLPPTPEEVEAFVKDDSPRAYEKVVERLLASPHYGERMAWDWLDAARYADSNGYQGDGERTMWPWRDWVVRAFNENMPYDAFTVWQLAGDLLPNATREQILATGFNRNHMINGEGGRIPEENRVEYVFDQTETTATLWLGLTFTCCRCHDHKFDPLSRTDYYRLFAFFNQTPVNGGGGSGQTAPVLDFASPEQERKRKEAQAAYDDLVNKLKPIESRLREAGMVKNKEGKYETTLPQVIESSLRKGPNDRADQNFDELSKFYQGKEPEYVKLLQAARSARKARDAAASNVPKVMVMADLPQPRETFILTRGAYDKHEQTVLPGKPGALPQPSANWLHWKRANRLDLARWLVSRDNPLTARVTVNRLWQMFFGMGLVKTAEDFGVQGERPSHPELLDWLAVEFMDSHWDVKHMVRLIVTSSTYRQSSRMTAELRERDPDNRLLARGPRRRLPAWMIRDQALAASGLLKPMVGGPPVKPYQPPGIWEEATFGNKRYQQDTGESLYRRSLYVFWRRIIGPTMFFDVANRQTCSVKTVITNTPLHALTTLNDVTYVEAARTLAQAAMHEGKHDWERLVFAFRRVAARPPSDVELGVLQDALKKQRALFSSDLAAAIKLLKLGESSRDASLDPVEHAALAVVCHMILNLDEVLTNQ
jgi:hypothetical protein